MLLLSNNDHNRDPTSTLCSTDANAHSSSPTSSTHAKDLIMDQGTTVPPLTGTPRTMSFFLYPLRFHLMLK
jgi:hypothetical protein